MTFLKAALNSGADGPAYVDASQVKTFGVARLGTSPNYTWRVTADGVELEGDYTTWADVVEAIRQLTRGVVLADYIA